MPEDKGLTRSEREEKILQFWKENKIFEKTLEKKSPKGDFVFYEGPPGANGRPGIHHLESRFFKDAIPRYKTMRGYKVPRKAGWDTHGLPVEIEAEKALGIKSKKEIEEFGVDKFNAECKKIVWKYVDEWERISDRTGFWLDFKNAYVTYHNSYIEKVWSIIKHVSDRDLLYKDYKVLPWCPRCETALSSHELAQGYQDVKDLSLYVKFKITQFPKAYFLAWTTTPWTLPGNLALAVGPNIVYVEAKVGENVFVLAKERLSIITEPYEIIAEHKGRDMVGMEYEPLYPFMAKSEKTHKVYEADFVTTEDGTGIVHTAVMYGQEDFELGTKVGLPKSHLVSPDGTFVKGTDWLEGRSVVDETLAVDILKDLQTQGLLFDKENHAHTYPFCWRCKTRLIYYARDSWYIRMSKLRDELVKENQKINWEPEYIKEGRFGEWLREVKDWAISRERYWGTPLPVWLGEGGDRIVVDSIETLKAHTKTNGNKFFIMRHGESIFNAKNILDPNGDPENHLTDKGKKEAAAAASKLKREKIDAIYASPFLRTRETAEIVRKELGLPESALIIDERLHEYNEDGMDFVRRRMGEFIFDIERVSSSKNILVVSHGNPLWVLDRLSCCEPSKDFASEKMMKTAEFKEIAFSPFPHDKDFELDLHKPYIDEVVLVKDGKEYKRTKEVMDVWLDSGAMPFASGVDYPADFIAEGLDQTRGWFYTLHAVGVLMGKGKSFNNVICLGLILDKEGKKMSKSVGNVVDPWVMIEKYGVDTLRLWMYSVNQPGDSKNFDERTVDEVNKRIFNMLDNVHTFYELYRDQGIESDASPKSKNILDKWILAKLTMLVEEVTTSMESYKLLEPVRGVRDFINDLSTWYLRRSRDRIKGGNKEAKQTLYYVLKTLSKLLAPFAPFAADEMYLKLRHEGDPESVHLEKWPSEDSFSSRLTRLLTGSDATRKTESSPVLKDMEEVRRIVSLGLEARSKANIKIRQPLSKLEVKELKLGDDYLELIKDEVNVKEVARGANLAEDIRLDTTLTPELIEEGRVRETIRAIQEIRKEKNLKPKDRMEFSPPIEERDFYEKHKKTIESATNTTLVNK